MIYGVSSSYIDENTACVYRGKRKGSGVRDDTEYRVRNTRQVICDTLAVGILGARLIYFLHCKLSLALESSTQHS